MVSQYTSDVNNTDWYLVVVLTSVQKQICPCKKNQLQHLHHCCRIRPQRWPTKIPSLNALLKHSKFELKWIHKKSETSCWMIFCPPTSLIDSIMDGGSPSNILGSEPQTETEQPTRGVVPPLLKQVKTSDTLEGHPCCVQSPNCCRINS